MKYDIKFRALKAGDEIFINSLRNDAEMEEKLAGEKKYVSLDRDAKWVFDLVMGDNKHLLYFAITENNSDEIIGYTSISDIDYRNGTCFWSGIKLSRKVSGKGYGFQAAIKIAQFVFEELRMVRCMAKCLEDHSIALKMMLKAGYKQEGLMRKVVYKSGKHINQWLLSMTDENYKEIKIQYNI